MLKKLIHLFILFYSLKEDLEVEGESSETHVVCVVGGFKLILGETRER